MCHALGKTVQRNTSHSRSIFLPSVYSLVLAAALVVMFATAQRNALCAVPAIVVTLPWSILFPVIIDRFAPPHVFDSMVPGAIIICSSGFINIVLLWFIGAARDRSSR